MRSPFVAAFAFAAGLALAPQDPQPSRPQPPPDYAGRPLPPIQEPFRTAVERRDLMQRFAEPSPLAGIWELTQMSRVGQAYVPNVKGWLFVGRRHLSIYLSAQTDDPQVPHLQARVCSYRIAGHQLQLTVLGGHANDHRGDIVIEPLQGHFSRRFELAGAQLRVWQDDKAFIDFKRID
jgi:hypothetical protein